MRPKTLICIECEGPNNGKGKVCEKCRYRNHRKDYNKQRYEQVYKPRMAQYNEARREARKLVSGKEPLSRYSRAYQDRKRGLAEYGATCQECGWNTYPDVLQVHHIDKNRNNHDLTNLAVLCPTCHMVFHYLDQSGLYTPHKPREKA